MRYSMRSTYFLCIIGLLKEFRPSEPFIFEFLTSSFKNFTEEQVNEDIYPISVYSNFVLMILMFFLTDICKCKPLIILMGISGIAIYSLLIWGTTFFHMVLVEILYGFLMASDIAFTTYPFKKLSPENYQHATGLIKTFVLIGNGLSGIVAQLLILYNVMNYLELNFLTLACMILVTIFAVFLEKITTTTDDAITPSSDKRTYLNKGLQMFKSYKKQLSSNKKLQKLSIFWILLFCLYLLVTTYMQSLWHKIEEESPATFYNGYIDSFVTVFSSLASLSAAYVKLDWNQYGVYISVVCLSIQALSMLTTSFLSSLYYSYGCYVIFRTAYQFLMTLCTAEIAHNITDNCYGFVFAANTFIALFLEIFIINVFVRKTFFHFDIREQFFTYGVLHFFVAIVFAIL